MTTFNPLRLSFWVSLSYVLSSIVTMVAVFSTAAHVQILERVTVGDVVPPSLAQISDTRERFVAGLQVGVYGVSCVLFLVWIYRVNRNARSLGANGMKYSPAWSVLWFFIPAANLVMPYLVIREIWKASNARAADEWRMRPVSPVLTIWWCIEVFNGLLHYDPTLALLGLRNLDDALQYPGGVDRLLEYYQGLFIWNTLCLVSSILSCIVVLLISDLQERKALLIVEELPI